MGKHLISNLKNGKGNLYPLTIDVLKKLKEKGYVLAYLSNSTIEYMETALDVYQIEEYFSGLYCAEMFPDYDKTAILKTVSNKFQKEIMMIGDRHQDMEAGYKNKIDTVFCRYGFGEEKEGENATYHIDSITDLLKIL